jgi:hypothetical protein
MTEEDLEGLYKRVLKLKMDELFEEPCPLYEDDEDDDYRLVNLH